MPVNKLTKAKEIIAKVFRDFRPTDEDFVIDALEWTGDAMGLIGAGPQYEDRWRFLTVENYRALLPCELEQVKQVGHVMTKGKTLSQIDQGNIIPLIESSATSSVRGDRENPDWEAKYTDQYKYKIEGNYIRTELEKGTLIIYYTGFPVDEDGYPMIPDISSYKEAIHWYIIMKLMERGLKHPSGIRFDSAEARWLKYAGQAFADSNYPSIDQYESFRRQWTNMIDNIHHHDRFFEELNSRGDTSPYYYGQYGNEGLV